MFLHTNINIAHKLHHFINRKSELEGINFSQCSHLHRVQYPGKIILIDCELLNQNYANIFFIFILNTRELISTFSRNNCHKPFSMARMLGVSTHYTCQQSSNINFINVMIPNVIVE